MQVTASEAVSRCLLGAGSPRGCDERSPGSTLGNVGRQRPTGTEAPPAKTPTRPGGNKEDLIAKWGGPSRLRRGLGVLCV